VPLTARAKLFPGATGKKSQHQQFHNKQKKGTPFSEVLMAIFSSREIGAFNSKSYTILAAGGFIPIIISRRKRLHLQQELYCLQ
jgi:hypothetical protein